jgi:putative membrane protein
MQRSSVPVVPFLPRLLLAWAINMGALWVANAIFDGVRIHGWSAYLIGAAVLGVANAVIKPIVAILTLPLIIVTLGVSYFLINVAMLALAAWIAPNFSVSGFWTYVGAVVVIWAINHLASGIVDRKPQRRVTRSVRYELKR